ncbi:hypothetical protein AMTRI_Chr10g4150 [Amborella trichopoda]
MNLCGRTSDIVNIFEFFRYIYANKILHPNSFLSCSLPWSNLSFTFQPFNSKRNMGIQKVKKGEALNGIKKRERQGFKEKIVTNFESKM